MHFLWVQLNYVNSKFILNTYKKLQQNICNSNSPKIKEKILIILTKFSDLNLSNFFLKKMLDWLMHLIQNVN